MEFSGRKAIVWFRQDLRLHDNEALADAISLCTEVYPVYVFDERLYEGKTSFGFPKITYPRAQFILESVQNLRESLRSRGGDLWIRYGKTEDIIFQMASQLRTSWVSCNRERTFEEVKIQDALEKKLWTIGQEMRYYRGKMLYHTADLPFPITHTPDTFSQFRKEVEKFVKIREPLPVPHTIRVGSDQFVEKGEMPYISDLSPEIWERSDQAQTAFPGGEKAGIDRLQYYLWETNHISTYKQTRNGLLGMDYSSKFSPYLAQGCISPKMIYHEISKYEQERGKNKSTYWLKFELMWRDFFRFMAKKHGDAIFKLEGFLKNFEAVKNMQEDWQNFRKWAHAKTGIPFIDANMREINATGFMSNRGRQNVASFLIHDLKINWLMGAEYFESLLIDYDPASNYGNWGYLAGVGSDPMDFRYFNILSQAKRYDPEGEYVKHWIPELSSLPAELIHEIYNLGTDQMAKYKYRCEENYPSPIVTPNW